MFWGGGGGGGEGEGGLNRFSGHNPRPYLKAYGKYPKIQNTEVS